MRILIVDDEPPARERLCALIEDLPECEVIGEAGDGRAALRLCKTETPDLVLLDIRMPGLDGLETARHLQALDTPPAVVFCTAFSDHALEAFDANAIDYLVKPIRAERLSQALAKAQRLSTQALSDTAKAQGKARSHLCARVRNDLKLVAIENVVYLQADQKYVTVCHTEGELLIEDSLTSLEAEFGERFLRIHRNALAARAFLAGLEQNKDAWVVRFKGVDRALEVSRRNLAMVRQVMKSL